MIDINIDDMVLDFIYKRAYKKGLKIAIKVRRCLEKNPTASDATIAAAN